MSGARTPTLKVFETKATENPFGAEVGAEVEAEVEVDKKAQRS
jgi:hypothetical protein